MLCAVIYFSSLPWLISSRWFCNAFAKEILKSIPFFHSVAFTALYEILYPTQMITSMGQCVMCNAFFFTLIYNLKVVTSTVLDRFTNVLQNLPQSQYVLPVVLDLGLWFQDYWKKIAAFFLFSTGGAHQMGRVISNHWQLHCLFNSLFMVWAGKHFHFMISSWSWAIISGVSLMKNYIHSENKVVRWRF